MGAVENKKQRRESVLKNRYSVGSKLSTHKFLRILSGYGAGLPVPELERTTHVSGKTIRSTYQALRRELATAVQSEPQAFGSAGTILFEDSALRGEATEFLAALGASRLYRRYRHLHAPRLQRSEEEHALIFELAVRMFCAMDLRGVDQATIGWEAHVLARLESAICGHSPRAPLSTLALAIPGARTHLHASHRFTEDYRRYLAAHPLSRRCQS